MALYQLRMPNHHFAETIINNFFRASFRALEVPTQEQCQELLSGLFPGPHPTVQLRVEVPDALFQYLQPHKVPRKICLRKFMVKSKPQDCAICLNKTKRRHLRLPCGHEFHLCCMRRWIKENPSCPVCRASLE